MFRLQAFSGAASPVADSIAASWYTWVIFSLAMRLARPSLSSTFSCA